MPETNTLPEQIIETSRAFSQTLESENLVFQAQLNGAVEMTINAIRELIALCSEAVAIGHADTAKGKQKVADTAQKALADVQNAAKPAGKVPVAAAPVSDQLDNAVVHAVSLSYENAVNAQQQAYILQQAATTQVIATLLSLATATLGVAVKDAEDGA